MCHCVWHDKEGWQLSEETQKTDLANFKELNITSWRNWGDANDNMLKKFGDMGCTLAPTMRNKVPASCYKDGKPSGNKWASAAEREAFAERIKEIYNIEHTELIETYLLGNEQTMKGRDTSRRLVFSGYDEETQNAFRLVWLKERFGTIDRLNSLCKTDFGSFSAVDIGDNRLLNTEYWFFIRNSFESFLQYGIDEVHKQRPEIKFGYARLMGRAGPTCDDANCDRMETATQNLYWHWWRDFSRYSVRLDELCSVSDRPVYITEVGFMSLYSRETEEIAARRFRQLLPLLYMRPQVQGSYVFCYSGQLPKNDPLVAEYTWGLCRPDRSRRPAFYAVRQLYADFKRLDGILGSFRTVQLAAVTNQLADELMTELYDSDKIARVLYTFGVPVRFVRGDKYKDIAQLDINRLIINDSILYSSPNGSEGEAQALEKYISANGNRAATFNRCGFEELYGATREIEGVEQLSADKCSPSAVWRELAPFIHGDFVNGVASGGNDADTVRILDVSAKEKQRLWNIEQQLLYTDNGIFLAVVNTGERAVSELCVTFGSTAESGFSPSPEVICADGGVTAERDAATVPKWIKTECGLEFSAIKIKNLDTYAFIAL